jgi:glucokinase
VDDVAAACRAGDATAIDLLAEIGTWLGAGLAAVAAVLDPEVIVVGGGVVENGDLLLDPARTEFRRRLPAAGDRPVAEIRAAHLGPEAGLVGAADLARAGAA